MLLTGRMNTLTVDHVDQRGAWLLAEPEAVLLPKGEVPASLRPGEELTVFIYGDAGGRPQATLRQPRAMLGEFALFPVSQVTPQGVFLDWGIGKDLLVPYSKQPERMQSGRLYLAKVCIDREGRLYGNGRIDACLEPGPGDLAVGQAVALVLWQTTELGAKVIVDHRWAGLLYRDELRPELQPGDRLNGFVKALRADGKIDVTLRKGGADEVAAAKAAILSALQETGFLPLHDGSSPAAIRDALGLSKKLFKKAVGGLFKAGAVELTEAGVKLKRR
jgi:predicted RNA-binding protein (virulence factor B family)